MTYDLLHACLTNALSYGFGSYVMYRLMRPKVIKASFQYEAMRQAFQDKLAQNQLLYTGQEKLWKAYQELLRHKLNQS